jgi:hypothetical protein
MNDDDVRAALAAYAEGAPLPLDPKPAVHRRIAAARRRRTATVSTALAVALVAPVAAVALAHGDGNARLTQAASAPPPTRSYVSFASPSPSAPAPRGSRPPRRSPGAFLTPSPSARLTQQPVVVPGPTVEESYPPGLRVSVSLDPAGPAAATYAVLTIDATDDDGSPLVTAVDWGDGDVRTFGYPMAACPIIEPDTTDEPRGARNTGTFTHAWRYPGVFTVSVTVLSMRQCTRRPPPREEQTATVTAAVGDGPVVSNGAHHPRVGDTGAVHDEGTAARAVRLYADLSDDDGYVGAATVDWGDGSTPATFTNEEPCDDGDGRHYPTWGSMVLQAEHTYAADGTYTATVTFTSTGCDGEDPQEASGDERFAVPAPPP